MKEKDIIRIQNNDEFIKLLKAQRVAYSQAKLFQILDLISVLSAIILPFIAISNTGLIDSISAFGVIWTIIYLIGENFRKKKTECGAKIQEQFDTELFELDWNTILVGDRINPETIFDLSDKIYDKTNLINWYSRSIKDSLPLNIKVLLCQRINSSWELDLRKRFVYFIIALLVIYYGIFISYLVINNTGIFDSLLLLSPSISFLIYGVQHSIALNKQANSRKSLLSTIDEMVENYKSFGNIPDKISLRQIQDVIFNHRTAPEKVPDWYYDIFKKYNENKTNKIINDLLN